MEFQRKVFSNRLKVACVENKVRVGSLLAYSQKHFVYLLTLMHAWHKGKKMPEELEKIFTELKT